MSVSSSYVGCRFDNAAPVFIDWFFIDAERLSASEYGNSLFVARTRIRRWFKKRLADRKKQDGRILKKGAPHGMVRAEIPQSNKIGRKLSEGKL